MEPGSDERSGAVDLELLVGRRAGTIQDYGSLGEFISAVATVVTLAYLALQVRQNTKAVRAAAVDSGIGHSMGVRESLYENASLAHIYIEGSKDPEALPEEDRVRFRLPYHNILLSLWNIFSQTRLAGLPEETWSAQIPLLVRVLSTNGGK